MSYKISYDTAAAPDNHRFDLRKFGIIMLLFALIACAITVKTVGLPWVREVLLPGDPDVTAAALESLVADLQQGTPLGDAFEAFCTEIIAHGS